MKKIACLILIAASILTGCSNNEKVSNYLIAEETEASISSEEIEQLMRDAHTTLYLNIAGCTALSDGISRVWEAAINVRNADFNDAISSLFQGKGYSFVDKKIVSDKYATDFKVALDTLKEQHSILEKDMRKLTTSGVEGDAYEMLSNLYSEYAVLYNQVINPSGSYMSYTAVRNDAIANIGRTAATLDVIWPY